MQTVERIRPRSKRKALSAQRLANRYLLKATELYHGGHVDEAEKLRAKGEFWAARYDRYSRMAHTW